MDLPPPQYTLSIISLVRPPWYASPITSPTPPPYTSSTVGLIPSPQYASPAMSLITPLSCRCGSIYRISPEVDEWIKSTAPMPYLYYCTKISHLANTANAHIKARATGYNKSGFTAASLPRAWLARQWMSSKVRLKSLPAAVVHDIVKPPYYLARMAKSVGK